MKDEKMNKTPYHSHIIYTFMRYYRYLAHYKKTIVLRDTLAQEDAFTQVQRHLFSD